MLLRLGAMLSYVNLSIYRSVSPARTMDKKARAVHWLTFAYHWNGRNRVDLSVKSVTVSYLFYYIFNVLRPCFVDRRRPIKRLRLHWAAYPGFNKRGAKYEGWGEVGEGRVPLLLEVRSMAPRKFLRKCKLKHVFWSNLLVFSKCLNS